MTTTQTTPSGSPSHAVERRWPIWLFRLTITPPRSWPSTRPSSPASSSPARYAALRLHRDMATYTVAAIAASIVTAILWRRAGAGPRWAVPAAVALFALTALQTFLGYRLVLAVHIPLGVTVIMLLVALTAAAWRPTR